jgi:hypothetical protein
MCQNQTENYYCSYKNIFTLILTLMVFSFNPCNAYTFICFMGLKKILALPALRGLSQK